MFLVVYILYFLVCISCAKILLFERFIEKNVRFFSVKNLQQLKTRKISIVIQVFTLIIQNKYNINKFPSRENPKNSNRLNNRNITL
jgi:hypothetical protein